MKNREKFAKEILDIACSGRNIAVTKENKIAYCSNISCESCMFDNCGKHIGRSQECSDQLRKWAESEYVETPVITSKEKKFLDLLLPNYKYIATDIQKHLKIGRNKTYQLIQLSSFPKIKIGNTYRIPKEKYLKWISDNIRKTIFL